MKEHAQHPLVFAFAEVDRLLQLLQELRAWLAHLVRLSLPLHDGDGSMY
jgi:hypothetical protein